MVVGDDRRRRLRLPGDLLLLRLVRTTSYRPFVLYRYVAGVAVLLIIATGCDPLPSEHEVRRHIRPQIYGNSEAATPVKIL